MTNAEALSILRQYNAWRRGDSDQRHFDPDPKKIGQAIDHACQVLKKATL